MEDLICVSVNYKLCDESFRGKFAFNEEQKSELISAAGGCAVVLCTCNRTELYYFGEEALGVRIFSEFGGISEAEIKRKIMIYRGSGAISHLFKVACGIDSMIVGEDEILGQLKGAYTFAADGQKLSAEMNLIFQSAIAAAKKIKTETELSKTAVSAATLAAKLAVNFANSDDNSSREIRVMLIGASGKTGGTVLKNLLSYKNVSVAATTRFHKGAVGIFAENPALKIIPYERRYEHIGECGCVISATSSPHFTLTADKLGSISDGEKRLFIDLAVPRDIDPKIAEIEGAELYGIDYFTELAKENNARKLTSVARAEIIIESEIGELKKQLLFHEILPEFGGISARLSELSAEELFYKLKSRLSYDAFSEIIDIIKNL